VNKESNTDLLYFVLVGADEVPNAAVAYHAGAGSDCHVVTITGRTASLLTQLSSSSRLVISTAFLIVTSML